MTTKYVEFHEPFALLQHGEVEEVIDCVVRVTVEDAVIVQKYNASKKDYTYDSNDKALEDFITVHWGRIVENLS